MVTTPPPAAPPPTSESELLARAERLAGRPLRWIAERQGVAVPPDQRRHKGWIGQLFEQTLGASAGSAALPDFPHLGVEMKTLPVDARGRPRESTYVCTAPLDGSLAQTWSEAWVRRKLSRVLWVPIVGDARVPLGDRIAGAPLLWSPTPDQEAALRADWEELTEPLLRGEYWLISARMGQSLQLRPKAANAQQTTWAVDDDGEWIRVNPMGFYLRARFTRDLLARHFALG